MSKATWIQHFLGYWAAGDLRVSREGKSYVAYRIYADRWPVHVMTNGRRKHFRILALAMAAAEKL